MEEIEQLRKELEEIKVSIKEASDKVEIYKNAMQQVVNLAFGLIASATLAIIISNVLNK